MAIIYKFETAACIYFPTLITPNVAVEKPTDFDPRQLTFTKPGISGAFLAIIHCSFLQVQSEDDETVQEWNFRCDL
jgi:hypothetical protein